MKAKQKTIAKRVIKGSTQARHHTRRLLIPHKSNNYRPHLIRSQGIIAVLVIALVAQLIYGFATTGRLEILGRVSNIETTDLLSKTNEERVKEGAQALVLNESLSQAAFLKAQDMFMNDYWAHTSPSGVKPWKWLADVGYNYSVAGENLAKNYPTAPATVAAWMNSETHRANIVNNKYTDVGFAVVDGELEGRETTLVVAFYGAPVTQAATQGASTAQVEYAAPVSGQVSPLSYFGSAVQSLSPVTIISLGLLGLMAIIGVVAHHYRDRMPKAWKQSWKLHHGLYTFWGMLALGVLVIVATGGGSI